MEAVLGTRGELAPAVAWPTPAHLMVVAQRNEGRRLYFVCKRLFDFLVAGLLLILLSPLMLLIAILIVLDTSGPAIFTQPRVGLRRRRNGRGAAWEVETFTFYKFRSMVNGADPAVHQTFTQALIRNDEATVELLLAGEGRLKKMTNDPRVTRVGRFLRKSSLDELPQLWNVLRGDMSLVGPRPPTVYEAEAYDRRQAQRLGAVTGMTGLWQVKERCCATYQQMIKWDLEYIEQQSFWLDLKILILTPVAVLKARGAA